MWKFLSGLLTGSVGLYLVQLSLPLEPINKLLLGEETCIEVAAAYGDETLIEGRYSFSAFWKDKSKTEHGYIVLHDGGVFNNKFLRTGETLPNIEFERTTRVRHAATKSDKSAPADGIILLKATREGKLLSGPLYKATCA